MVSLSSCILVLTIQIGFVTVLLVNPAMMPEIAALRDPRPILGFRVFFVRS